MFDSKVVFAKKQLQREKFEMLSNTKEQKVLLYYLQNHCCDTKPLSGDKRVESWVEQNGKNARKKMKQDDQLAVA